MLGSTLNRRFRLEQRLGSGPNPPQFLATDETNGEMLTVRFLPRHVSLRGESGLRYRRALARLKGIHHPHLLVPVEASTAGGTAFLATPYYPSVTLAEALAAQPPAPPSRAAQPPAPQPPAPQPLAIADVARVLQQIAGALDVLHGAGVVHGGVNLDNILLAREDELQAVLTHPALSLLVPPEEESAQAAQFKAPEESPTLEMEPDGRSDLYALGMVAWRLLTGEMPFAAVSPSDAYRHHLATPPANPRTRNAEIPARLAAIVMKLLAKSPSRRYQSAAGLCADLETWEQTTERLLGERDVPRPFTQIQPILGRETAREALLAGLGRAGSGQGSIVVFAGAPGMGKGRLFRALQPHLLAAGTLVLRARPPAGEACAPFFLLQAWGEDLLSQWELLPDLRRRDLLYRLHQAVGNNGPLLSAIVPGLEPLLPQSGQPPALETAREHLRVLHTAAEAVAALADPRHPLLLWIEDFTRVDGDSLALLRFLNDRLPEAAIVLAGGYPLEGSGSGPVAEWLQAPPARRHVAWVELPALEGDSIRESVAALLGIPWQAPPPPAVDLVASLADWIARRWGGVPLAHELALRLLVARDVLVPDIAHRMHGLPWRLERDALERLHAPDALAGLVRAWLATLPEGVMLLLEAAAQIPAAITLEALAAVLDGFPADALAERLEAAIHHGVLYRARDGLRFAESRVQQAIAEDTAAVRRQLHHQELGAGMEAGANQGTEAGADPGTRARADQGLLRHHFSAAWHFRQGGDGERALAHTLALVPAALAAGAFQGASAAFRRIPDGARAQLAHGDYLALIAAAAAAGHTQAAADLAAVRLSAVGAPVAADALAAAGADEEQADLLLAQAALAAGQGNLDAALTGAEQALALLGEQLPHHAVGAALARLADGAARRYGELISTAAGGAPAPLTPAEERRCRALEIYARAAARRDPERAAAADERIVRIAAPRIVTGPLLRALIRLGRMDAHPEARPLQEAEALLRKTDLPAEAVSLGIALGQGALAQFQLIRAREAFDRAREAARALGDLLSEAEAELGLFDVARLQGPGEGLARAAARLQRLAALTHAPDLDVVSLAAGAFAQAAVGSLPAGAAIGTVLAAAEHFAARAQPDDVRHWLTAALETMLTLGHTDEARRCIALADRLGAPLSVHAQGRLTAALAEWHLVLAAALPDQPHPRQQARAGLKALRAPARGQALLALLWEGLSAIERIAQGRVEDGLAQAAALESALEAQGARLLWGRLCLRVAEALRDAGGKAQPAGDKTWLAWGGKALMAFDAAGAAGFAQATRRLLGLASDETAAEGGGTAAVTGGGAIGAGLVPWFDRLAGAGAQPAQGLHEALLRLFLDQADGERAALYVPNADGQLALAHQLPLEALATEPFNRWMVETVRREGRGQVAEHYLPPTADPALAAVQEAQSVLCLPLPAAGRVQGVVALSSSRSRRVYNGADLARLSQVGHQAALLLALNDALGGLTAQRHAETARHARDREVLAWSQRAASGATARDILADYLDVIAQPNGFEAAILLRLERGAQRRLVPELACVAAPMTAKELSEPLPLAGGESQAAAALETLAPVAMSGGAGPQPSPAEQALFNQWHARDAVWLPLAVRSDAAGVVVLLARERRALPAPRLETDLLAPLRAVAPAIVRALEAEDLRREQRALLRRQAEQQESEGRLRRHLPAALDGARRYPDRPGAALEVELPVVAGRVQGLGRLARLGALEWSRALDAYYQRVGQGLDLHQGTLDQISGSTWLAHFPGGAHSAIWGAHTLQGLLAALAEDHAAAGLVPMRTGLGVHLGPALAGTLAVGDRLQAVLEGEAVRGANALAAMAEQLRCGVLVSGDLAREAASLPDVALRPFGTLRLGVGERRLEVFDLYSARPEPVARAMRELGEAWETAIRHFRLGEWERAWPLFHRYAARLPEDRAARYFLRRCRLRQRTAEAGAAPAD